MKFEELSFISIGGCCASVYTLGKNRLRGPVDNVLIYSYKAIDLLLNNRYLDFIKNTIPGKRKKTKEVPDYESEFCYEYPEVVRIAHNKVDDKYFKDLAPRVKNLNTFLDSLKTDCHKYLIFTIPYSFIDSNKEKLIDNRLINLIKYLSSKKLLNKVIFVGVRKKADIKHWVWWNNYIPNNELTKLKAKYKDLLYIELTNISMANEEEKLKVYPQFKDKINLLFNKPKNKLNKKQTKTEPQPSYYLYF